MSKPRWITCLGAVGAALMMAAALVSAGSPTDLEAQVDAAMRSWDVDRASEVVAAVRAASAGRSEGVCGLLLARADLAVATMLRVEFEATPDGERTERRLLGQRIDAFAEEGLSSLGGCPDSSERWRIEADLLMMMIRSDFRAKKYQDRLQSAIDTALALDENNPSAWVVSAKPFLYADANQGGDLEEGVRRLSKALALDPHLESALVLRAYALDRLGRADDAQADLDAALRINPLCRPAQLARDRASAGSD